MKIHAIVDYSFLYYKYKFQLDSGRIRRLTVPYDDGAVVREKDISQIYYSIKEIEGFRRKLEQAGHDVVVSICFDMPSDRKKVEDGATEEETEAANNYKANRVSILGDDDFSNMRLVEELVSDAGHNTYRVEGYEADDLVAYLIDKHSDEFDYNIIYTPDADLLMHIKDNVGASRFKATKGYTSVDRGNFEEYLTAEMKCRVPYNSLMLLKSTVGDKSDQIAGIVRFGPKAFDKLVVYLDGLGVDWEKQGDYESTLSLLKKCEGYLTDLQLTQAIESLSLVRPMVLEGGSLDKPTKQSTDILREESYMRYNMASLIK